MSDPTDAALGLTAGAIITAAVRAADEPATTSLIVGGGAGLFLALIPRSRAGGLALLAASIAGAVVVSQQSKRQRA